MNTISKKQSVKMNAKEVGAGKRPATSGKQVALSWD